MHKSITLGLILTAFISCKKEKNNPENNSWHMVQEIKNEDKNSSFCYSNGNLLFIRSLTSYQLIDSNQKFLSNNFLLTNPSYCYRPFPMKNDYFVTISDGSNPIGIRFRSISTPSDFGDFHFEMDTNIIGLDNLFISSLNPPYLVSPSGNYIFKVKDKTNLNNATLVLTSLKNPVVIRKITLSSLSNYLSLHFYYLGKFYFSNTSINPEFFSIDSLGEYEKVSNFGFSSVSEINGVFYGIGPYYDLSISFDYGKSWKQTSLKLPSSNLINVKGKAICFTDDWLGEIQIIGNNINLIGYNVNGIEGNAITRICYHNGVYYCTTKSGVFNLKDKYFAPK